MCTPRAVFLWGSLLVISIVFAGCRATAPLRGTPEASEPEMPARAFFVQVGMNYHRADAESTRAEAVAWWSALDTPPEPLQRYREPPVHVVWRSPYYRVRIGPVATRSEADVVRASLRERFDDAFIARGSSEQP
ncbi:hypothetical protein CRI93_09895 [Longimonas halophila]|uniref:SPOR domain-containing protein n=1 Tax=Longimonas halophila TaxID=1469170 RepID=A0A2H3NSA0_9BACT|nr:SPOR domain-containing protein [Longimonas halophila]PEN06581.1 hypothetical protein CRI93_09895 [Longimonas halophila]